MCIPCTSPFFPNQSKIKLFRIETDANKYLPPLLSGQVSHRLRVDPPQLPTHHPSQAFHCSPSLLHRIPVISLAGEQNVFSVQPAHVTLLYVISFHRGISSWVVLVSDEPIVSFSVLEKSICSASYCLQMHAHTFSMLHTCKPIRPSRVSSTHCSSSLSIVFSGIKKCKTDGLRHLMRSFHRLCELYM